jgi:transglutaminase-like putative cysteine protease
MIRRVASGPAEGWLSLGLVLLMCVTMAWAIDDVAPVMGRDSYTDFLMWAAVGGVLMGFIGPKSGLGRWRTYLLGAVVAALVVPWLVGAHLPASDGSPYGHFHATAESAVRAYIELVIEGSPFTNEYGHHLWVIGLLVWATSMFAAYATFGHRRPLNAVVLIGAALVINMSLTVNDQLGYLVMYSVASMALLIRFHALDEQAEWLRRRIGDPAAISGIYLRGGSVFIILAVAGSLLLTKTAASDPLAGAWDGVSDNMVEVSRSLAKYLPGGPNSRNLGSEFGDDTQIRGFWVSDDRLYATIQLSPDEDDRFYWRASTFDTFNLNGWTTSQTTDFTKPADDALLDGTLEDVADTVATRPVRFTVTPAEYKGAYVLSPHRPDTVSQTSTLRLLGPGGLFVALKRDSSPNPYSVTALVPVRGEGGLESNRLIEAGTDYPQEILDTYLQVPDGAMGPSAEATLAAMIAAAPNGANSTPYELAKTMETLFHRKDLFEYDTNVQDLPCVEEGLSSVECFARYTRGYCQYYASTMAIFLRELGVPARIAEGFLPGTRDERSGQETLLGRNRHQWVEVYFPGYGWVPFDPTGGDLAELPPLPTGAPLASSSPRPSASFGSGGIPGATRDPRDDGPEVVPGGPRAGTGGGPSAGLLGAVAVLLAAAVGSLMFMTWRRGPRGETSPDRAYGSVTRLAARLGFGPRPNQTVYEYAGALAEVLPEARPQLETVAQAKVESTYGRTILGADGLHALREAERRLRVTLLRLLFRRDQRPRR